MRPGPPRSAPKRSLGTPRQDTPRPLEDQVQLVIQEALELCGFTVLHTTAYRQKGPSGVSYGVPDLICYHERLPYMMLGIEVKRPGGTLTVAQEQHVKRRGYFVARSPLEAVHAAATWLRTIQSCASLDLEVLVGNRINSIAAQLR